MSTAPTRALEAILDLTPLDIFMCSDARMTAYRMKLQYQWYGRPSSGGHTSITKKIHHPTLLMPSDCMERKYVFERPFEIVFPTREELYNNTIDAKNDDLIWFTDGSKKGNLSGMGICGVSSRFNLFEGLGEYAASFRRRNGTLLWNQYEDYIEGHPKMGKQEMNKVWRNSPGQKHAKSMISSPSAKVASEILRFPRLKIQTIVGFITGHYHFRKHLHRMGVFEQESICRKCREAVESAHHHILYECDALALTRLTTLGNPYPKELHLNSIKGLSDYVNKVGDQCHPRQRN
ncbi:uncharacterized protein [Parasteatoda tepidariorum]|uniref:uncharacterized protein n=1 Tax=Parasteatoda tepidariorum TaxID=114398 RepID=UPI0039BD2C9B